MPIVQEIYPHAEFLVTPDERQLIYVDNGQPILGVAHLDGTMKARRFGYIHQLEANKHIIFSEFVDDRSGAYALLKLLPQLDLGIDLLFSVGEEVGDPTSQFFSSQRQYNWMFQFDRMGQDAVHYQYTGPIWLQSLQKYFGQINHGAFSDICWLDHLRCMGVNIGTAYYEYTDPTAHMVLDGLVEQVRKFEGFYKEHKEHYFPHTAPKVSPFRRKTRKARHAKNAG